MQIVAPAMNLRQVGELGYNFFILLGGKPAVFRRVFLCFFEIFNYFQHIFISDQVLLLYSFLNNADFITFAITNFYL